MYKLDDNLLHQLGLGSLPPVEKNKMLNHIYETLELRVGMKLAEQMSDEQLDAFERLMPAEGDSSETIAGKEKEAFSWLENNFPDYKKVVADELENLKAEISAQAPQILAATMSELGGTAPPSSS